MSLEAKILQKLKEFNGPVGMAELIESFGGSDEIRLKVREMVLCGTLNINREWELEIAIPANNRRVREANKQG